MVRMMRSRAATLRFFRRLPDHAILQPRAQGKWSVKDTFAHIVAWEEEACQRLKLIAEGRGDRIVFFDDRAPVHRFNARAVAGAHGRSWLALRRRAVQVRRSLVRALLALSQAQLDDRSQRYAVVEWLPELAWTHEEGHLARLRRWWRRR